MGGNSKRAPGTWGQAVPVGFAEINAPLDRQQPLARRRVRRIAPPGVYGPQRIRATRAKFGASQNVFATLPGG